MKKQCYGLSLIIVIFASFALSNCANQATKQREYMSNGRGKNDRPLLLHNGTYSSKYDFLYDSAGHVTEKRYYNDSDQLTETEIIVYKNGKISKQTSYNADSKAVKTTDYDAKGRVICVKDFLICSKEEYMYYGDTTTVVEYFQDPKYGIFSFRSYENPVENCSYELCSTTTSITHTDNSIERYYQNKSEPKITFSQCFVTAIDYYTGNFKPPTESIFINGVRVKYLKHEYKNGVHVGMTSIDSAGKVIFSFPVTPLKENQELGIWTKMKGNTEETGYIIKSYDTTLNLSGEIYYDKNGKVVQSI